MTALDALAGPAVGTMVGMDPPRLEVTFRSLGPAVQGYLRAAGAADAEDLLGEVFLRVARGLPRFSGDSDALRRWVFTIAHHCLADEHRRRDRQRRLLRRLPPSAPITEPALFDPTLIQALATLTSEQREVVTLRFVADLSLETVAEMTARPVGAVKSLQHRALQALSGLLAPPD